jgi:hypothetical protein
MVGHAAADDQQSETAMDGFKRFVMGVAGVGMLAAGLSLVPSDAEAFKCVRSWIPFGEPTGVECARSCESEYYNVGGGRLVCVVYGPKIPLAR